jgi:transcriptional regulator with XRE-family HTH domain
LRAIHEDEWLEIFSAKIKRALIEQGLNQGQLAMMSNISDTALSSYIRREKIPGARAIINIAHALDMTVDELIDYGADIF